MMAAWDLYNITMEDIPDVNVGVGDHASILVGSSLSTPYSPFVTPLEFTPLPPHPSPLRYRSPHVGTAWDMSELHDEKCYPYDTGDQCDDGGDDEDDDDISEDLCDVSTGAASAISIMTDALRAACEVLDDYMESLKQSNRSIRDLKSRIKLSNESPRKRMKFATIV
jgi:hypothetical protein